MEEIKQLIEKAAVYTDPEQREYPGFEQLYLFNYEGVLHLLSLVYLEGFTEGGAGWRHRQHAKADCKPHLDKFTDNLKQ